MHISTALRDELNNIGQVKRTKDTSSGPSVSPTTAHLQPPHKRRYGTGHGKRLFTDGEG